MNTSRGLTNLQIAELLRSVAAAYQLKDAGKNKFKIVAYQKAADAVEHASSELKDLWDEGKLDDIPGIGPSIAGHLSEMFSTGKSKHFAEVMAGLPPAMFKLMEVPGIGPKTAYRLAHELSLKTFADLEKAAKKGHIAKLPGFGKQSEIDILRSLDEVRGREKRQILPYADQIASEMVLWMKQNKYVKRIEPLGSLRRRVSTIGDIDLAAATEKGNLVLEHFTKFPKAQRVLEKGERSAGIIVPGNIQVDLMVETPDAFGAMLQHFTGSKHHNIALREFALKKGLSLSDYGIYILNDKGKKKGAVTKAAKGVSRPIKRDKSEYKELKKFATEEAFYKFIGMDYIPPEMREDSGEIKKATEHMLPKLVELKDIKADFHMHSDFDVETSHDTGESSIEELVGKADSLGYEYFSLSEHNPSQSGHNMSQIVEILKRKREKVDKVNYSLQNKAKISVKKVFNSLEIDIKPQGGVPVDDKGLDTLDFANVSIHSSFRQSKEDTTKRVLSALAHPKVKIFSHPTGRKLNEREGVDLDWDQVFDFCIKFNKWVEINCDPMRLDLPDNLVREAVKRGVMLTLGTDAHHKDGLDNMRWGISVARRGWAEARNIINTLNLVEFEKMLEL